jgi:nicotinamidase-related amidase
MPITLAELIDPRTTAVIVNEMKRVTCGDLQASSPPGAPGNELAEVADKMALVPNVATMLKAARAAGVRVIHATAAYREDGVGSTVNCPMLASAFKHRRRLLLGSPEAEPALEVYEPEDLHSVRLHGLSPFTGTDLDPLLRSLGIVNLVIVGGSVNVGVMGATIEAINLGYRLVIPRDCVVGAPAEYAEAVIENTLRFLATITTGEDLADAWAAMR